jgi:hypothetical protein
MTCALTNLPEQCSPLPPKQPQPRRLPVPRLPSCPCPTARACGLLAADRAGQWLASIGKSNSLFHRLRAYPVAHSVPPGTTLRRRVLLQPTLQYDDLKLCHFTDAIIVRQEQAGTKFSCCSDLDGSLVAVNGAMQEVANPA